MKRKTILVVDDEPRLVRLVKVCHAGKVITHEDLLTRVWGPEYRNELHYLRNYISSLRKKIEDDPGNPRYILSKHGVGYYLVSDL
jgi:two-component system KDP operon response regulator KdpE